MPTMLSRTLKMSNNSNSTFFESVFVLEQSVDMEVRRHDSTAGVNGQHEATALYTSPLSPGRTVLSHYDQLR